MNKIKAIVPCSGFGTRVGMRPNQSKELLLDSNGKPLIDYSLEICQKYDLEPLFTTRAEKTDLINYLYERNHKVLVMKPGEEWAQTVYNSKSFWAEQNILMLPDTRFEPENIIEKIKQLFNWNYQVIFATHKVDDITKWGHIGPWGFCEKPKTIERKKDWPLINNSRCWGLIGFTKEAGEYLFKCMQDNEYHDNFNNTTSIILDKFEDLTRNSKIS